MSVILIEKIIIAITLLSMIPGFIWGWKDAHLEDLPARIFLAFIGAIIPPIAIATVLVMVAIIAAALTFIFS